MSTIDSTFTTATTTSVSSLSTTEAFTPNPFLDEGLTRSPGSTTVSDFFGNVSEIFLAATTEAHRAEAPDVTEALEHQPDQPDAAAAADAEKRNLLIGVVCLTIILIVLLAAISYFFYRV